MTNQDSQVQNSNKPNDRVNRPVKRKGGSGFFFIILFLILVGAGVFLFKKQQIGLPNMNNIPFTSSLNLPTNDNIPNPAVNNNTNLVVHENNYSQNKPFEYSQNNNVNNTPPPNTPPPSVKKPNIRKKTIKPKTENISNNTEKVLVRGDRVYSGYSGESANIKNNNNSVNNNLVSGNNRLYGNIETIQPEKEEHNLAVKPNYVMSFQTNFSEKNQAINHIMSKLGEMGFSRIQIQIDDYSRGGSTVVEGLNSAGEQAYFSVKPIYIGGDLRTKWKLETYKASNL